MRFSHDLHQMEPFAELKEKQTLAPAMRLQGIYPLSRQIEDNVPYVPMEPRFELGYLGRGSRTDRVAMLEAEQPVTDLFSQVKLYKLYSRK